MKLPSEIDKLMINLLGEKVWKVRKIIISTDTKIRKQKGYESET